MTIRAVVPVKPFNKGKSRLNHLLEPEALYRLNVSLFFSTLKSLLDSHEFDDVVVISRSKSALRWAEEKGAVALVEQTPRSLNSAVSQAISWLDSRSVADIVVLPTDLPLVTSKDISQLIAISAEPGIIIVPDRHKSGTNAICMKGGARIEPCFGVHSFQKHCSAVLAKDLPLTVWLNERIGMDLDTQTDLEIIQSETDLKINTSNNKLKGKPHHE